MPQTFTRLSACSTTGPFISNPHTRLEIVMSSPIPVRVTGARQAARDEAEAAGIDRALIAALVDQFYEKVRADADLGPIFETAIGADWDRHLDTMKTFWGSITFHDGVYSGRPMPAHMKLNGLTPQHFQTWLALFDDTLSEIGASTEAQAFFRERADRIARSFQLHIFYQPPA